MAKNIGLDLQIIEPTDLIKDGDDVISANAQATRAAFLEDRARIAQVELAAGFDGSLSVTDDAVAPLIGDTGTSTGSAMDSRYVAYEELLTPGTETDDYLTNKIYNAQQDGDGFEMVPPTTATAGTVGTRVTVPTHVTPAGGQTTHPSLVFISEGWNGYKYWMAHTPYPGGLDDHEDPNVAASNDGITWVVPAGLSNPIDDADGQPEYNSDVELVMGPNRTMYLFWRYYDEALVGSEERLYYSTSTNGVTWAAKKLFHQANHTVLRLVSPSIIFTGERWIMWGVDILPSPNQVVRRVSLGKEPDSGWSAPVVCNIGAMQSGKEPWHITVIRHGGRYVSLLTDCTLDTGGSAGDLLFMVSADGITWTNSGGTVIPRTQTDEHNNLYRATMIPAVKDGLLGFRVWYSAFLTGPPNIWNVFRTWIGPVSTTAAPKATAYGETNPTSNVLASGGGTNIPITFPAGRFTTPPSVMVSTDSTRLNIGAGAITATGFTYIVTNWTSAAAGTGSKLYWAATEK